MFTYKQAEEKLNAKSKIKLCHETWLEYVDTNCIGIRYHKTYVVKMYPDGTYELNNGGYLTKTTKERINEYAPISLYQKNFCWYYGNGQEFSNGMVVR